MKDTCCCQGAAILLRFGVLILLSAAFVLSCQAVRSCKFLQYHSDEKDDSGYAGLFSYRYASDPECIPYDGLEVGPATKSARIGALVAPIVAFFALLLAAVEFLSAKTCLCRHLVPSLLLMATAMQGLTFILLASGAVWCVLHKSMCLCAEFIYRYNTW